MKSKGLGALEKIKNISWFAPKETKAKLKDFYDFAIIEKELKALEIIKRNRYEAVQCLAYDIYEDYILWYNNFGKIEPPITQEEYELLKEVLEND